MWPISHSDISTEEELPTPHPHLHLVSDLQEFLCLSGGASPSASPSEPFLGTLSWERGARLCWRKEQSLGWGWRGMTLPQAPAAP